MPRNEHIQDPQPSSCKFVKADGARCRARPRRGSAYCFFHDPTTASERRAARHAGGVERSKKAAVLDESEPDCPLESVGHICALLGQTINQVRKGTVDPRVGNSVGYLAGVMLKALDMGELEKRLARLETLVQREPPNVDDVFGNVLNAGEPAGSEVSR